MTDPSIQLMLNKAQVLLQENRIVDARDIYQEVCRKDKNNVNAWLMLGNLDGALGDVHAAEKHSLQAILLNPALAEAHAVLGNAYMAQKLFEKAAVAFTSATDINPALFTAWFLLGKAEQELLHYNKAELAYSKAIDLNSDWVDARLSLGVVLQLSGKFDQAQQQYEYILKINNNHAEAHFRLAILASNVGQNEKAEKEFRKTLEISPDYIPALNNLSMILSSTGEPDEALELCKQALSIDQNDINAACLTSHIYEVRGEVEKAYQYLKPHLEANIKQTNLALAFAGISKELKLEDQAIDMIEKQLAVAPSATDTSQRNLHFTIGKLYDSITQYDSAFEHYQKGNKLWNHPYDSEKRNIKTDSLIETLSSDFFNNAQKSTVTSDRPVFIVGMPRSGTSLVEQILASHPLIHGAGELSEIGQIISKLPSLLASDKPYPQILQNIDTNILDLCANQYLDLLNMKNNTSVRIVDKMPGNFFNLGLIQLLFPNARVINCARDPLDVCLSCYFQDFFQSANWSYNLKHIGEYYLSYEKIMHHWENTLSIPIFNVEYKELVSNQEKVSRALIDFCGLEWADECLNFHATKRYVSTASYDQVRKPMYSKSVERWKNYEKHLDPLKRALGKIL